MRLDVRADDSGRLFVLEANPKPDLKAPDATATSIICAGLGRHGMDYDDLVLSIFASRIGALLEEQGSSAGRFAAADRGLIPAHPRRA